MTSPTVTPDFHTVNPSPDIEPEPWRSMTAEDALAYLADADAAQRTLEGRRAANRLGLVGIANHRRLVAWRRENQLCPKCGSGLPADEPFKHCPRCRQSFREYQRHFNANLNEPQRRARNERARRSYHKIMHGKPPPSKVVAPETPAGPKRDRAAYFRTYRAAKTKLKAEAQLK